MHYLGKESGNKNSVGPSGHEIVYVHVCTNVCVCVVCVSVCIYVCVAFILKICIHTNIYVFAI